MIGAVIELVLSRRVGLDPLSRIVQAFSQIRYYSMIE